MTKPAHAGLTTEDFMLFPDDGNRHEILEGDHYMTPPPNTRHQAISVRLLLILGTFVETQRLGQIFSAPTGVVLSEHDVVQPDLLFIAAARATIIREMLIEGAPDLVIEIVSPGSRRIDQVLKRRQYERCGVKEYWIVDPELETVRIYRSEPAGYGTGTELSAERQDHLTSALLPGFTAAVSEIFPD